MNDAKYIGLDVHQATISATVLDSNGKLVMESILETIELQKNSKLMALIKADKAGKVAFRRVPRGHSLDEHVCRPSVFHRRPAR